MPAKGMGYSGKYIQEEQKAKAEGISPRKAMASSMPKHNAKMGRKSNPGDKGNLKHGG